MAEQRSRGARRRLTKDERRTRILEAAAHAFSDRGYEAASIDEIADRAGITKPVIYDHFASKRKLYVSLLELYSAELFAFMGKRVLAEGSSEERFEAGFDAVLQFVETHPVAWRMLFRDPPPSEPEIVEAVDRLRQQATAATVTLIASGPVIDHPDDPVGFELVLEREMAAELINAVTNGLATWWYGHRDVPREHLVYVMMNAVWVGFERFTAGERWRR